MGPVTGVILFLIFWWLSFLICLPWGVRANHAPAPGHDTGAPLKTQLRVKMLVSTVASGVLLAITYWGIAARWVTLDM